LTRNIRTHLGLDAPQDMRLAPTPELRQVADGTFYAFWSEQRRSKRKSMGTSSRAEAETRFAHWLLLRNDKTPEETVYTVNDCWTVYRTKHVLKDVASPETLEHSWQALAPHFGTMQIAQVDQDAVDRYLLRRTSGRFGRFGRAVQSATVRRELLALFACLRFCAKQKMFKAALIETIDLPAGNEPRDRWLTTAEIAAMRAAAARLRRGPKLSRGERFLWVALATAGRKEALLDLTWDRVDFETDVIHLDVPGRAKTKKRRASVPISSELRPFLLRAYEERENDLVMGSKADVWLPIQKIVVEAGLGAKEDRIVPRATGISPHTLRHTAATHMARQGVPIWIIAKVLGNTIAMVEQVYAKHCPDDLRAAVNLISSGTAAAA